MEAFDAAEEDTVERAREVDYYALILPERVCVAGAAGDPGRPDLRNVTVVRLEMPLETARALLQKQVTLLGPLSPDQDPAADTPLVMHVQAMKAPAPRG